MGRRGNKACVDGAPGESCKHTYDWKTGYCGFGERAGCSYACAPCFVKAIM